MWVDEVAIMIQDHKLSLFSDSEIVLTKNKTLMDYGVQFTNREKLYNINYAQRYKMVYLPIELFGLTGKEITDCYSKDKEMSSIEQKNIISPPTKPIKVQYKHQRQFITWLCQQKIETEFDFDEYVSWCWKSNETITMIEIIENNKIYYFKRTQISSVFKRCRDENKIENESFEYGILGRSYSNGVIKVLLHKKVNNTSEQKSKLN